MWTVNSYQKIYDEKEETRKAFKEKLNKRKRKIIIIKVAWNYRIKVLVHQIRFWSKHSSATKKVIKIAYKNVPVLIMKDISDVKRMNNFRKSQNKWQNKHKHNCPVISHHRE